MQVDQFNKAMGVVIRKERMTRGLSMKQLGDQLGFSYQQVGKYETGSNGCSAHLLIKLAEVFQLPVAELYERTGVQLKASLPQPEDDDAFMVSRYVKKISNSYVRHAVIDFTRKLAYQGAKA